MKFRSVSKYVAGQNLPGESSMEFSLPGNPLSWSEQHGPGTHCAWIVQSHSQPESRRVFF
jgi:hypothetical protein